MKTIKPILKWAGGKRRLVNTLQTLMPENYNTYIEPFCGSAALYFTIQPEIAILNDKNEELINCYIQIRDKLPYVKRELNKHTINHSEEYYYQMRDLFNQRHRTGRLNSVDAALMIYLNKAGFNGMYRENLNGDFNIPSGKKASVILYNADNINQCALQLRTAELHNDDFEVIANMAQANDFVFFDSPYDNCFHNYQSGGFTENEHRRLANLFRDLTRRGVYCLLTNYETKLIKELYPLEDYPRTYASVSKMISYTGEKQTVEEVIIRNY